MATGEPKYAPAKNWSKAKRADEAAKKVAFEGYTQARAGELYGVSRQAVNKHSQRVRAEHAARLERAELELATRIEIASRSPQGMFEERRVGTFEEFDARYFSKWICPDCEKHHVTPSFHIEMADALEGSSKRLVMNLPPHHSKSTIVTVKHTIFKICQNPNYRRIIISKSNNFAKTFLHSISELLVNEDLYIDQPSLIEDWGPFRPEGKSSIWSREQIYVSGRVTPEKDPTVQVLGVGGQIYGRRANDIVCDDIADLENQRNPQSVAKILEWLDKEASSRVGRNGRMLYVGTRVHPGDIYSYLRTRKNYQVLSFPCILDEEGEITLWPDHFPFDSAIIKREEMRPADWQLVYQNVDIPGLGASWNEEMIEGGKDTSRVLGQHLPDWRLIAGIDLAGGNTGSGYTAGVLKGIDLRTGNRFYVDLFNEKSMKAPRLRDHILDWADAYPIYEFRVESNGLQSQIIQYNEELIRELALRGVRVVPHITGSNKWDPEFGVESMAPLWQPDATLVSVPWGNAPSQRRFQPLLEQLLVFPMGVQSDLVMADWFADLGCRDLLKRAHLPLFSDRMKVPDRIRRKRVLIDFGSQTVRRVPIEDQRGLTAARTQTSSFRRRTLGRPQPHTYEEPPAPEPRKFVNVEGGPDDPR